MQKIDAFYLYQVGYQIHPLSELKFSQTGVLGTTYRDAQIPILLAELALEALLQRSVFELRTARSAGYELLSAIRNVKSKYENVSANFDDALDAMDVFNITSSLSKFETVLQAEFGVGNFYLVGRKGGYEISVLVESGMDIFPSDLATKVPEAVLDLKKATRCIAFELETAAAFHLHRAMEAVVRKYWDVTTSGQPHPKNRSIGSYIAEMEKISAGDARLLSALRDLKDFHRNPILHPDQSLETIEEAIALLNGIYNVMVYILRYIPTSDTFQIAKN